MGACSEDEVLDITAMVFEEIHVPAKQDPEPLIKSCLRDGAERVTMGQAGNNLVYANSAGHGVLEDLENLKKQIAILMAKDEGRASQIVQHQQQIVQHQQQIASLEKQVSRLSQSSEGYLAIRRRFLDVYKRDIKGMEEVKGNKAIREGNNIAHEGDALGDAALFDRDQRTDRRVYRELYGLDHQQVLEFQSKNDDGALFLVLNAHATMLAQGKPLPSALKVAFNSFVAKVEEHWLQPPAKEPNTALGAAYYTFWKVFNQKAQV